MKTLITIILTMTLTTPGFAQGKYSNSEYGFSAEWSDTWKRMDKLSPQLIAQGQKLVLLCNSNDCNKNSIVMIGAKIDERFKGMTNKKFVKIVRKETFINAIHKHIKSVGGEVLDYYGVGLSDIGNLRGYYGVFETIQGDISLTTLRIFTLHNGVIYQVHFATEPDSFAHDVNKVREITDSFKGGL